MDIMEYMFDQDNVTRLYGIEQWRIGRKKGFEMGRREGLKTGRREGLETGRKEGLETGRKEGLETGVKNEKKATAINLLAMNMDIPFIEKATGLSKAEILMLKEH